MAEQRVPRRLAAILAADVVGYSRLMERDEAGTLARLKRMRREILDPAVAAHAGRVVKLMGDGALVEFASAVDAVACAIAIQDAVRARAAAEPADAAIQFRVGINVGDIIVDGDDIYGDGVNIAARIEALAEPDGIWLSAAAAEQIRDKLPVRLESCGTRALKNIVRPVEVFRVAAGSEPAASILAARAVDNASIAVLAFNNMSGDAEQEYFSDGISEDIITDLSKLSELHVIARNSSFVYKKSPASVPEIGRTLGVHYVLEGSVRKAGNRVRVTAQLIDAIGGGHVWADRYDRELTDIFSVQDELTREIVSALRIRLTAGEEGRLAAKRTVDIAAYEHFLRGREQSWSHTRTGNVAARELLSRAVAIDPDYAAAHARLAFTHVIDYINGWSDDPPRSLATGVEMAERAVEMDADEPQAHFALAVAMIWTGLLDRARAAAERALMLSPNSSEGHLAMAHTQIFLGNPMAAVETIKACFRLDPLFPEIALYFLAEAQFSLGDYEQAADALQQRLERNPHSETTHALLASCYGHLGRMAEARAEWKQTLQLKPDYSLERRRHVLPFRNPADFDRRLEGLRKAGLPV
jgi:adenylate cyclase